MRIVHTMDSQKLTEFAMKYPAQWHTYKLDKKTKAAIDRAKLLGKIETNEFNQFKLVDK